LKREIRAELVVSVDMSLQSRNIMRVVCYFLKFIPVSNELIAEHAQILKFKNTNQLPHEDEQACRVKPHVRTYEVFAQF